MKMFDHRFFITGLHVLWSLRWFFEYSNLDDKFEIFWKIGASEYISQEFNWLSWIDLQTYYSTVPSPFYFIILSLSIRFLLQLWVCELWSICVVPYKILCSVRNSKHTRLTRGCYTNLAVCQIGQMLKN